MSEDGVTSQSYRPWLLYSQCNGLQPAPTPPDSEIKKNLSGLGPCSAHRQNGCLRTGARAMGTKMIEVKLREGQEGPKLTPDGAGGQDTAVSSNPEFQEFSLGILCYP